MPVPIKTVRAALHGPGRYRIMNTVEALAEALLYYWPVGMPRHDGRRLRASERLRTRQSLGKENAEPPSAHYLARAACIAALEAALGDVTATPETRAQLAKEARAAFIRACEEADIHVILDNIH
jgi:hypothetical protein